MENSARKNGKGAEGLAKALGWFGIGLGLAEVATSRAVARLIGVERQLRLLPALGMREVISGIGILAQRQPAGWMWSRVAGDAIDLGLLGLAAAGGPKDSGRLRLASGAVAGVTLLDLWCAICLSRHSAK